MSASTFAQELATRLIGSEQYGVLLGTLQSKGVIQTLHRKPDDAPIDPDDLAKLLYCAEVFVQTEDEKLHRQAQEIAIQTLLVSNFDGSEAPRERALSLLTELENFPGLKFVEQSIVKSKPSLLALINRRVSETLNTVDFGGELRALTAYQRRVWDSLPNTKAAVISAPTSAGKSFLVVEHLCRKAEQSEKFVAAYVTPTRALLSEVHLKVQARLQDLPGVRVSAIPTLEDEQTHPKQIFILTQERLSTLLSIAPSDLAFDLLVVDEAQNIADDSRGMILQDCLERIAARSNRTQVIMLAPGAIGMSDVAKTFGISDLDTLSTQLSPVQQNRIVLTKVHRKPKVISLAVIGRGAVRHKLGEVELGDSLNDAKSRLARVALEFGGDGGSLLYETGPREAEKAAEYLVELLKAQGVRPSEGPLEELSKFIKEHVHPEYQLAEMVRYGVAFHYGRMPSLLREAIETAFKQDSGGIKYLVCTTTLAQGVNLPARNVFIDTPKYGQGKPLNPALLWNFAGRAGRLSQDVVGNVFLLDYEKWDSSPMDDFVPFTVKSATADTLQTLGPRITAALTDGVLPKASTVDPTPGLVRSGAGLMVAHAARKDIGAYLQGVMGSTPSEDVEALAVAASTAYEHINLPDHILADNWTIDPFGLKRLYDNLLEKIEEGRIAELLPVNPKEADSGFYEAIFGRIVTQVNNESWKFGALAGRLAVEWMKGIPYPEMLGRWISRRRTSEEKAAAQAIEEGKTPAKPKTVDALIRDAFDLIEETVRFEFVQLGKAYRDLLLQALRKTGNEELVPKVFDFALALELGISSKIGAAYVELGLSRIAASALERLSPTDGPLTAMEARKLLRELNVAEAKLSPIIVSELRRLGLIEAELQVSDAV
ncbi:DEAD/DEAH box helicase [Herbaspirillum seropedicae]|uniref:DEAD/DEAH box helicase n=1 Tax=Herbaspirillum seropedicae TaxID=964 RepID=UPI000848015B|nr:DEAD/DEAH box helicase [Herbaspirillum seropedicae]AON53133.1 dead/deah box helicase domain-containing protein [Herbaspirillum seropedicae]